jgi:hypothetical protein
MTFAEFRAARKSVNAAEMKRAGVTPNEQTKTGWLYSGGLVIESTDGWEYEFMGMYCWMIELREHFSDDLEKLEQMLYERYCRGGNAASSKP